MARRYANIRSMSRSTQARVRIGRALHPTERDDLNGVVDEVETRPSKENGKTNYSTVIAEPH
jgi:hypothetical protein